MAKYDPLRQLLDEAASPRVEVAFERIADLVGGLPRSATEHRAWWANDATHVHARAWLDSGFRVELVDLSGKRVRFVSV